MEGSPWTDPAPSRGVPSRPGPHRPAHAASAASEWDGGPKRDGGRPARRARCPLVTSRGLYTPPRDRGVHLGLHVGQLVRVRSGKAWAR